VGLDYALGVAREFQSSLLLFHSVIVQPYALDNASAALQVPNLIKVQEEYAEEELEKLRRELARKSIKVETVIGLGSPVEQLNDCVRSHRVDLIVTSTHGRTGLKRLFMGSTAEQIVHHAIFSSSRGAESTVAEEAAKTALKSRPKKQREFEQVTGSWRLTNACRRRSETLA